MKNEKKCICKTERELMEDLVAVYGPEAKIVYKDNKLEYEGVGNGELSICEVLSKCYDINVTKVIVENDSAAPVIWIVFEKEERKKFLLIATDGYSIDSTSYNTIKEAQEAMNKAYEAYTPDENDESSEEMSYCSSTSAILYANGEDVYVWDIVSV